jgi:redox-sensing transcriptional repressor
MPNRRAPVPTLERLATYLTFLTELNALGVEMISSSDIEARTGINAAQFRKDLSYFGEFGRPGIGYNVQDLVTRVARILKVEQEQSVLLIGAGNLGSAIAGYPGLRAQNFHIVAVFDNNFSKIGRRLWDLEIYDTAELQTRNQELQAKLAIIAVPAAVAQDVADVLVQADIKAILNFAPVTLKLPPDVAARNVDFVQELAVLSFSISRGDGEGELK